MFLLRAEYFNTLVNSKSARFFCALNREEKNSRMC